MIEKEKLLNLYLKDKHSAFEISKILNYSEHKVNYWLEKHKIPKRSVSEAIYAKYNPHGDPFCIKEVKTIEDAELLGFGLGLYWGEGNKKNKSSVRLGNTDSKLIKKFIEFLIKICRVPTRKLKFSLQIFSDLSEKKAMNFWLKELKDYAINRDQFCKTTITPFRSIGNYREKSKYGVLSVYFHNIKFKKIIDNLLPK